MEFSTKSSKFDVNIKILFCLLAVGISFFVMLFKDLLVHASDSREFSILVKSRFQQTTFLSF